MKCRQGEGDHRQLWPWRRSENRRFSPHKCWLLYDLHAGYHCGNNLHDAMQCITSVYFNLWLSSIQTKPSIRGPPQKYTASCMSLFKPLLIGGKPNNFVCAIGKFHCSWCLVKIDRRRSKLALPFTQPNTGTEWTTTDSCMTQIHQIYANINLDTIKNKQEWIFTAEIQANNCDCDCSQIWWSQKHWRHQTHEQTSMNTEYICINYANNCFWISGERFTKKCQSRKTNPPCNVFVCKSFCKEDNALLQNIWEPSYSKTKQDNKTIATKQQQRNRNTLRMPTFDNDKFSKTKGPYTGNTTCAYFLIPKLWMTNTQTVTFATHNYPHSEHHGFYLTLPFALCRFEDNYLQSKSHALYSFFSGCSLGKSRAERPSVTEAKS